VFHRVTKKIELKQKLSTIAISPDNAFLFIGTAMGDILVHDARVPEKEICTLSIGTSDPIITLAAQVRRRWSKTSQN
jgi:hypothetical protein